MIIALISYIIIVAILANYGIDAHIKSTERNIRKRVGITEDEEKELK